MTDQPIMAFIRHLTALADQNAPVEHWLREVPQAMTSILASEAWLPSELKAPHPDHYQQYLVYCDPKARFSIVSFVWGPGQRTPIHDHTVWGAVGQLRGREISTNYHHTSKGFIVKSVDTLDQGQTISFSPEGGDIHEVKNGSDDVSISIHVYGADIGRIERHVFDPISGEARSFVSGYSSAPVPVWAVKP
jgi:3-mercaptopropionate dioxygenase